MNNYSNRFKSILSEYSPTELWNVKPKTKKTHVLAPKNEDKEDKHHYCGPTPSKAQLDYIQNGLVLPKKKENLEILLRDVQSKGFFDHELNYRLRKKEAVEDLKNDLEDKINTPSSGKIDTDNNSLDYNPLIESYRSTVYSRRFRKILG
jgi:hypothetical protein